MLAWSDLRWRVLLQNKSAVMMDDDRVFTFHICPWINNYFWLTKKWTPMIDTCLFRWAGGELGQHVTIPWLLGLGKALCTVSFGFSPRQHWLLSISAALHFLMEHFCPVRPGWVISLWFLLQVCLSLFWVSSFQAYVPSLFLSHTVNHGFSVSRPSLFPTHQKIGSYLWWLRQEPVVFIVSEHCFMAVHSLESLELSGMSDWVSRQCCVRRNLPRMSALNSYYRTRDPCSA